MKNKLLISALALFTASTMSVAAIAQQGVCEYGNGTHFFSSKQIIVGSVVPLNREYAKKVEILRLDSKKYVNGYYFGTGTLKKLYPTKYRKIMRFTCN